MTHSDSSSWQLDTLLVHGSERNHSTDSAGEPTVQPIYTSTTYLHSDAQSLDESFSGLLPTGEPAYVYARQGNPNAHTLEDVLLHAEGGAGAFVFSSGMAAIHAALMAAGLAPGSKIVAAQDLYGPTIGMMRSVFSPLGIEVVLCDLCSPDVAEILDAERPNVIYVETLSNPLVKVTDLDAISSAASRVKALTIVDSTFTTPYLVRPIEHGFDLVVHSATKFLGGHGDSTAGVIVCAKKSLLEKLRAYATMLGAMLSPFESYLITRGIKTLALRMERQCSSALQLAHFLQQHPVVERVYYPGLPNHPQHDLANRLFDSGRCGGILAFELKEQSRAAAFRFMDKLQLCLPATTLGDVYSLVSYPPMSSHRSLTAVERAKVGITEGCIRLSVGIEDVRDIMHDLDQALKN